MTQPDGQPPRTLTSVKQYRLVRELGRGGMGVVYEGVDTRDNSHVAVKLLHPWLVSADSSYFDRFEREAHIAALLRSPYTVRLVDFGVADENYFLVMEYIDGSSVADLIEQGPVEPMRAIRIAIDIARALEEAVARGVVHRDIKPANVLLTSDGHVKVTDFGIARHEGGSGLTAAGAFVGTADYAAPEQVTGESDHRSDIYSLGATLYCMLVGHPPFKANTVYELLTMHQTAPLPTGPLAHLPEAIVNPIRRCMEKDPRDRYQTPSELAGALERALTALGRTASGATPISGPRSTGSSAGTRPIAPPPGSAQGSAGGVRPPSPPPPPAARPATAPATAAATRVAGTPAAGSESTRVAQPPPPAPPAPQYTPAPPQYAPPPAYAQTPAPQPPPRKGGSGKLIAIIAAIVVAGGAAAAVFLFAAGGDDDGTTPATGTATAGPATVTATSTGIASPTTSPEATATTPPTSAPTPTATRVLPTPVLQGFPTIPLPATSPEREVIDAINRNGPAYSAAINRRDESLLMTVFTGAALDKYAADVAAERQKPVPSQNTLLAISLVELTVTGPTSANVKTLETWRFQSGNSCSEIVYDEFYQLALIDGSWFIATNQFTQRSAKAC
ncbi:MAG: serine/threonine-protein kinase [Dehalococcoidia bacterium]